MSYDISLSSQRGWSLERKRDKELYKLYQAARWAGTFEKGDIELLQVGTFAKLPPRGYKAPRRGIIIAKSRKTVAFQEGMPSRIC